MARLADIAADMEIQARRTGSSIRDLGGGLRMQLSWVAGTKTLILSRPVVKPSETEISVCRGVFFVPSDAQRLDGDRSVTLRWSS